MEDPGSDVINGQLSMLTNIYGGRILIIDQDFRVIKDTYDMDRGKAIISQEVIQSFQGKETSQYDRKNNYLEMTVRIQNTETKETLGVMLVSISTDEIRANMKILETKGMTILSIITLLVLVFGYLLAGILMKPFQKVTRSIEDITDGYLDEKHFCSGLPRDRADHGRIQQDADPRPYARRFPPGICFERLA